MSFSPLSGPGWPADDFLERQASNISQTSPTRTAKPKPKPDSPISARLPPPSLFQGPPSHNASNISLPYPPGASAAVIGLTASASLSLSASASASKSGTALSPTSPDSLQRIPSRQPPNPKKPSDLPSYSAAKATTTTTPAAVVAAAISRPHPPFSRQTSEANARRENDRADALWAEMQKTLAEVELSAANGSNIFGAGHAQALEELRTAQLALAQAWARSEKDELEGQAAREAGVEGEGDEDERVGRLRVGGLSGLAKGRERDGKSGGGKEQQQQAGSVRDGTGDDEKERRKTLEEETEHDILLARTRREANDRYFAQVNTTVLDVVKKLDEVAGAMRQVEKESRDIWSEDDNEDGDEDEGEDGIGNGNGSGSVTGSTTGG